MKLSNAPEVHDHLLVSVIIPTYNRPTYLKDALLSLLTQNFDGERYEVLVVDNGPAAEARAPLEAVTKSALPVVRYIRESTIGLHNGRHTGAREARGQVLAYVDDDVIVHPEWLKALVEPFADTQVGCVGGKVLPKWEDVNPPDWWSRIDDSYLSLLDLGDRQLTLSWPRTIHGCNMAIRRPVLYQVGGFNPDAIGDPRLIWLRGDGETGLLKKIYSAGYKVVYEPGAWLYHRIPASRLTPEYFFSRAFIQGISDSACGSFFFRIRALLFEFPEEPPRRSRGQM